MFRLALVSFLLFTFDLSAKKHKHREHSAHSHGHAQLSIAFDGIRGQMEFKSPAESIVGFEHEAKSEKDKKVFAAAAKQFEDKVSSNILFDSSAGCVISKKSIEMTPDKDGGNHADFVAFFNILCTQSVMGTKLTFDFTSYKKLKQIDAVILVGDKQIKSEISSKKVTVDLK